MNQLTFNITPGRWDFIPRTVDYEYDGVRYREYYFLCFSFEIENKSANA